MFVKIGQLNGTSGNPAKACLAGTDRVNTMSSQPTSGRAAGAMPFDKYTAFRAIDLPDRQWPSQVLTQAPRWCSVDLRDGNQALIDPMSVQYLTGAEIGYKEDLSGAQFIIRNPNASTTCGCGSSFSV